MSLKNKHLHVLQKSTNRALERVTPVFKQIIEKITNGEVSIYFSHPKLKATCGYDLLGNSATGKHSMVTHKSKHYLF